MKRILIVFAALLLFRAGLFLGATTSSASQQPSNAEAPTGRFYNLWGDQPEKQEFDEKVGNLRVRKLVWQELEDDPGTIRDVSGVTFRFDGDMPAGERFLLLGAQTWAEFDFSEFADHVYAVRISIDNGRGPVTIGLLLNQWSELLKRTEDMNWADESFSAMGFVSESPIESLKFTVGPTAGRDPSFLKVTEVEFFYEESEASE